MNVQDSIVEAVIELALTGEIEVPQDNDFGGADLWKVGQTGVKFDKQGRGYVAEGVRIAIDDNQVKVLRFEGNGLLVGEVRINESVATTELIQAIAQNLLNQK